MQLPVTLDAWLQWVEQQHSRPIDLGLDRVAQVRDSMLCAAVVDGQPSPVVITVAGTNGKGSTCVMLEAILRAAGYRVGLFTSPHLLRYNERVRVAGLEVDDARLCEAFLAVETARNGVALTYFEYGTLAAWYVFCQSALDVVILEVGMGGRLDAVNIFEPDCAVVTGIALDHQAFLGDTIEAIAFEKAGIYRTGKPAIFGSPEVPQSLRAHAEAIGADLRIQGRDFRFSGDRQQWQFAGRTMRRSGLAYPALRGANQLLNASTALAALESISERLPVPAQAVREGLMWVEWPGRFQILAGRPSVVLDVAHNAQSVAVLADNMANMGFFPQTIAVCGVLADKDIAGSLKHIISRIDHWLLCDLPGPRGAAASDLAKILAELGVKVPVSLCTNPQSAMTAARELAAEGDRIVVFGSFLTVAAVMKQPS